MVPSRVETGNTFNGFIHEFDGIRVDNFDNQANPFKPKQQVEFYLLTHAHADHLRGLETKTFSGKRIYGTKLTIELLLIDPKYRHKKPYLEALDCNKDYQIPYKGSYVDVVAIPSNHCPGSVMYLISDERAGKNVLLTGDIRAEQRWIETIIKIPYLYPFTTKLKSLDNIYLDTTYGYRQEPFIIMPKNSEGLNKLTNLLANYPTNDDDIHFYFPDSILGFEEVWSLVLPLFTSKVHITKPILKKLEKIFEYDHQCCYSTKFKNMLDVDCNQSNFHITNRPVRKDNVFNVVVKPVINIDRETFSKMNTTPAESELKYLYDTTNGHKVFKRTYENQFGNVVDSYHLKHKDTGMILNDTIAYFFSRHSSCDECLNFVSQFNVKEVYPITESKLSWNAGFQIGRHFGDLLTANEFLYDKVALKKYGPCPQILSKPNVIDILTNNVFNGIQLITAYKQKSFGLEFKGQQALKTAFAEEELTYEERVINNGYKLSKRYNFLITGTNHYRQVKLHNENPEKYIQQLRERVERRSTRDVESDYSQETDDGNSSLDDLDFELSPIKRKGSANDDNLNEGLVILTSNQTAKKRRLEQMMTSFYDAEESDLNTLKISKLNKERISLIERKIREDDQSEEFAIVLISTQNTNYGQYVI